MAKHQIIYTSCRRGRDSANDGQQVYSYDEGFREGRSDEVKSLFGYRVPALPPGILMTQELAEEMPSAFMYRLLKSGSVAVTLNTYLGRDYMGAAGRFGNHLSHSLVCDFDDLMVYPCELYGGPSLKSRMRFEEVNASEPPAYLDEPELVRGDVVSVDRVFSFLAEPDRLEAFKRMTAAMLTFSSEKRRIVLCDERDHIPLWIAALHYVLPLPIAKKVNFTTYEYDPELSPAQICGVVSEGTRYSAQAYVSSGRHYVFDFLNDCFSQVRAEDPFLEFLDTAISFDYDCLREFHEYVIGHTSYRECDENYYAAYSLYTLMTQGLAEVNREQFRSILSFAGTYLDIPERQELLYRLIEEREKLACLDWEYLLSVLRYLADCRGLLDEEHQEAVRGMIVDALIRVLTSEPDEEEQLKRYGDLCKLAGTLSLQLPVELMREDHGRTFLDLLAAETGVWKPGLSITIVSDYVKESELPVRELCPDRPVGSLFYGFVRIAYDRGEQEGCETALQILDSFRTDAGYYINKALNLEGFLYDLKAQEDADRLWEEVYARSCDMSDADLDVINHTLAESDRYENMYAIYARRLAKTGDLKDTMAFFGRYWSAWILTNREYAKQYADQVAGSYAQILRERKAGSPSDALRRAQEELLERVISSGMPMDAFADVIRELCGRIPLDHRPEEADRAIVYRLAKYLVGELKEPLTGRHLLLMIGLRMQAVSTRSELDPCLEQLKQCAAENGADFKEARMEELDAYFDWVFGRLSGMHLRPENYEALYGLFQWDPGTRSVFTRFWAVRVTKTARRGREYDDFARLLAYLFVTGEPEDLEEIEGLVAKWNKSRTEDLNAYMRYVFKENQKVFKAWQLVYQNASARKAGRYHLTDLFKKN